MVHGLCDLTLRGRWQDGKAATLQRALPVGHLPITVTALPSYQVAILTPCLNCRQEHMSHDATGVIQEHVGRSHTGSKQIIIILRGLAD